MIFISHRGNIDCSIPDKENEPNYIMNAISQRYYVEVDIWMIGDELWLGHDLPQYKIDCDFCTDRHLIFHAKNKEALVYCLTKGLHCFTHDIDDYTLTSRGYIWIYPNAPIPTYDKCIAMIKEDNKYLISDVSTLWGVCSDNISFYKHEIHFWNNINPR